MTPNFRRNDLNDSTTKTVNRITKEGVLFVAPFLRRPRAKPGQQAGPARKQVHEIRVVPPMEEGGHELAVLNPNANEKMGYSQILGDTFANFEVVRQLGYGLAGCEPTDMITSVRAEHDNLRVRGGWTPYYEMRHHLTRKIKQQRDRLLLGLSIDIPQKWIDWMTIGKYEFGALPQANGHSYTDKDGRVHPEQYLIKCVALMLDGEPRPPTPAVFMVPPQGASMFLQNITEAEFADRALSADNNRFGDFCTLNNGYTIEMYRTDDGKYALRRGRKMPMTAADAMRLDRPWAELVYVPTIEESVQWIAQAIGSTAAVAFGLRKTPDNPNSGTFERYLPKEWLDEVKDMAPELSKDEHTKAIKAEVQARQQVVLPPGAVPANPGSPAVPPPPAASAMPSAVRPEVTPPVRPAAPTQGFRSAPPPSAVDPARYDSALLEMRNRVGGTLQAEAQDAPPADDEGFG